jgi:hypothetical protein
MFDLLKAEATAGGGHVDDAYATLLARYAKTPEDAVSKAILKYGSTLGKSADQVDKDVWAVRDAVACRLPGQSRALDVLLPRLRTLPGGVSTF